MWEAVCVIVIVDYQMGNVGSILNMLKRVGADATISSDVEVIERADKLILPGVGAFDSGMSNIDHLGLMPVLNMKALTQKVPVLGICLGMQLLFEESEEGELPGLGWVNGKVIRFQFGETNSDLKVPHMGWNTVIVERGNTLFSNLNDDSRFYFVHSYHAVCERETDVLTRTNYGYEFVSSVQNDNIFGTQFHPEKSHKFGTQIYKNFVELT